MSLHAQARGTLDVRLDTHAWLTAHAEDAVETPPTAVRRGCHRLDLVYEKPPDVAPAVFARLLLDGRSTEVSPWPRRGGAGCAVAACATTRPSAFLLLAPLALLLAYTTPGVGRWRWMLRVGALAAGSKSFAQPWAGSPSAAPGVRRAYIPADASNGASVRLACD